MQKSEVYKIKLYDTVLAQFEFQETLAGHQARGLEIDKKQAGLLPLNIGAAPNDVELIRFLESRRIPKGRVYLENILRPYGLAPTDTKGIIDLSRGTSVNDPYSIVPADDDIPYREYSLFDNDFDEILQIVAYTGVFPEGALGGGRPSDLTPSGAFPKTWRKIDGQLVLFKAGSPIAAPNYGKEPISEFLAFQVAQAAKMDAVEYSLTEWQGKLCSTCPLFNTPDIAFTPFELCLPSNDIQLATLQDVMEFYSAIGQTARNKLNSLAVFDFIIANSDRHPGNFGVLRDMHTGCIVDAAPIFDNNVALFARFFDDQLQLEYMQEQAAHMPGIFDTPLGRQGKSLLGNTQIEQLRRLVDFEFNASDSIKQYQDKNPQERDAINVKRLETLSSFVRKQVALLLEQ